MTDAIIATLQSCAEFVKQRARRQSLPPLSIQKRQLITRIRSLETCQTTLASLLTEAGGKLLVTEEVRNALFAGALRNASSPLAAVGAFAKPKNSYEDIAKAIGSALFAASELTSELRRQQKGESGDLPGMTHKHPRTAHIQRLMVIFACLRNEQVATLGIGDPENDYNPLLGYLQAASTPIAGPGLEFPIFIPGGTLKADARLIRNAARMPSAR